MTIPIATTTEIDVGWRFKPNLDFEEKFATIRFKVKKQQRVTLYHPSGVYGITFVQPAKMITSGSSNKNGSGSGRSPHKGCDVPPLETCLLGS
ncbi:hypothetical protein MYOV003v1_p0120 [Vibrio phage 207E48.1]|nr:hypothetical protein MYOV003v1_p0120 [Vibrio phage 207E48.1]